MGTNFQSCIIILETCALDFECLEDQVFVSLIQAAAPQQGPHA